MTPSNPNLQLGQTFKIQGIDRWQVYRRLDELAVPCWCAPHQPLQVRIDNTTIALQVWSVLKQFTASKQELCEWLEGCWKAPLD